MKFEKRKEKFEHLTRYRSTSYLRTGSNLKSVLQSALKLKRGSPNPLVRSGAKLIAPRGLGRKREAMAREGLFLDN
jgi:hypothetical protein